MPAPTGGEAAALQAALALFSSASMDAAHLIQDSVDGYRLFEHLAREANAADPTVFTAPPCPRRAMIAGHADCGTPGGGTPRMACRRCPASAFDGAREMPLVARIRARMQPRCQARVATA